MIPAPPPRNEAARLAYLRSLQVLDTEPEEACDDLVRIAAEVCGTPIALISLIDEARQWFKSKIGIDAKETEREIAFCSHTILQHDVMVVEDATADPRFADNPLVTGDPHIRFYAGAPLETEHGLRLGTLCVIDRRPGTLNPQQKAILNRLGRQVVSQLELRRSHRLLAETSLQLDFVRQVVEQTQDPIYWISPADGFRFAYVNRAACRHYGYSAEELLRMSIPEWNPDITLEQCEKNWQIIREQKSLVLETRHRLQSGDVVPVEVSANYVRVGGAEYIAGTIRNIAERRHAERLLQQVVESAPNGILMVDVAGRIVLVNEQIEKMFGYSRQEMVGQSVELLIPERAQRRHPDLRESYFSSPVSRPMGAGRDLFGRCKDGREFPVEIGLNPITTPAGPQVLASVVDISERKDVERALLAKDRDLETAQSLAHLGSWTWEISTGREAWSEELYRIFGYEPGSVAATYERFVTALHQDDKDRVLTAVDATLKDDTPYDLEFRIYRPNGEERTIQGRGGVQRDRQGRAIRMHGTVLDVTSERRARRDRDVLTYAVDHGMEGLALLDQDGRYTYMNQAHASMYGYAINELLGKPWRDLYRPEVAGVVERDVFPRLLRDGSWTGELTGRKKNGEPVDVEISLRLMAGLSAGSPEFLACTCRDITERKRGEATLRRAHDELEQRVEERTRDLAAANQRLRLLSQQVVRTQEAERRRLARDLHDEIGQALTALKMNLQILRSHAEGAPDAFLSESLQLSDRLLQQVRRLALDLRPQLFDELGLEQAVRAYVERQAERNGWAASFVAEGLERRASEEIEMTCFRIVQEALTNIARHAKASGVDVLVRRLGDEFELVVRDDGIGFEPSQWDNTGKNRGHLGLTGMEERVRLVGGKMNVTSAPGRGTEVRVCIPCGPAGGTPQSEEGLP